MSKLMKTWLPEANNAAVHGTYERWLWYASCSITFNVGGEQDWAEFCRKVARICTDLYAKGESIGIWHGVWIASGMNHPCYCAPCCAKRKERHLPSNHNFHLHDIQAIDASDYEALK